MYISDRRPCRSPFEGLDQWFRVWGFKVEGLGCVLKPFGRHHTVEILKHVWTKPLNPDTHPYTPLPLNPAGHG